MTDYEQEILRKIIDCDYNGVRVCSYDLMNDPFMPGVSASKPDANQILRCINILIKKGLVFYTPEPGYESYNRPLKPNWDNVDEYLSSVQNQKFLQNLYNDLSDYHKRIIDQQERKIESAQNDGKRAFRLSVFSIAVAVIALAWDIIRTFIEQWLCRF